jgi:branched-subunit amino acid aminotransferase/4-amino-4-deoxychorismate lyase
MMDQTPQEIARLQCHTDGPQCLAVESFAVADGAIRGLDLHRQRFSAALSDHVPARWSSAVFDAALARVPAVGSWFPRIVAHGGDVLRISLEIRPLPQVEGDARVWLYPRPDTRSFPSRKGPDAEWCLQVRAEARQHGADDALLTDANGWIRECATSALTWWDGDVFCVVSEAQPHLASVTRALLIDLVRATGAPVEPRSARITDLAGCETWLLSAGRGLRVVKEWIGVSLSVAAPVRAPAFQAALQSLARPFAPGATDAQLA